VLLPHVVIKSQVNNMIITIKGREIIEGEEKYPQMKC
jgi:hypothetical protein